MAQQHFSRKCCCTRNQQQNHTHGLAKLELESLEARREILCLKHMFPQNPDLHIMETRNAEKYSVQFICEICEFEKL